METKMRSWIVLLVLLIAFPTAAIAEEKAKPKRTAAKTKISQAMPLAVGPFLQSTSVNVKASQSSYGGSQGSGTVLLVKQKGGGKPFTFILTAQHVVKGLREVKEVIVDGDTKKQVRYRDAVVVHEKPNASNTRVVGEERLDCKLLSVDEARDIALLQVRAVGEFEHSARFFSGGVVPAVGTAILHCGCPGGQETSGTGAVTAGIISRVGVPIPEFGGAEHGVFDHVDCAALGGSSGGMICRADDGQWIGMITLGLKTGDSFHWMVPIRSVVDWAEDIDAKWLLDPEAEITQDRIDKLPLENNAISGTPSPTPTLAPKSEFSPMDLSANL